MLKLINDSCSSNADYCNTKQNRVSVNLMFAFLNVDRHGTGSVLFKIIPQDIYVDMYGECWCLLVILIVTEMEGSLN